MLDHFNDGQLLVPWKHGEELDDAVFRIAATFPIRELQHRVYKIAGDEFFGFDPNAFVQRLIEETGVSHTWKPIRTRIGEGHCAFSFALVGFEGQAPLNPESETKRCAREVLWDAWDKYNHFQLSEQHKETDAKFVAMLFADFVINNIDLAQQLIAAFSGGGIPSFTLLTELERKSKSFFGDPVKTES